MIYARILFILFIVLYFVYYAMILLHLCKVIKLTKEEITFIKLLIPFYYFFKL